MTEPRSGGRSAATTSPTQETTLGGGPTRRVPGLLLAWAPPDLVTHDRAPLDPDVVVGRSSSARWCIPDDMLSRKHFELRSAGGRFVLNDLGSRNGTWVGGARLVEAREVNPGTVVRAGRCVFVLSPDLSEAASPGENAGGPFGIAGRFHAGALVRRLRVAARTDRHVLLEGETGSGKELAAATLHRLLAEHGRAGEFVPHNAARFTGEDDAVTSIFGITRGAFTGVEARPGAIELAANGTLFLDEVHNLPARVQRSLLRFVEDGLFQRVGEPRPRTVDVRLVLGTNVPVDEALGDGRLAHDLVARLHRVSVPPLRERRADVPGIATHVMRRRLPRDTAESVIACLDAPIVERLCSHEFRLGNVREIEDAVAVVGARIAEGDRPADAVTATVAEAFESPVTAAGGSAPVPTPTSLYERHRAEILAGWSLTDGNLTRLEETLRARGIGVNRRWLSVYLERWGVRAVRRRGDG